MINKCVINIYMNHRCIAKTQKGTQCQRKHKSGLCEQHYDIYRKYKKKQDKLEQTGGFPLLPSCLDVIRCDWITNITYALPGLNALVSLFSY